MPAKSQTPCIGVCSTVYGDLVCRGCKRFAHEIVEWNGYREVQKVVILERLAQLRDQAVDEHLRIEDPARLRAKVRAHRVPHADGDSLPSLAYALLWRGASRIVDLTAYGLRARNAEHAANVRVLLQAIEAEYYLRSQAHYERSHRTLAR